MKSSGLPPRILVVGCGRRGEGLKLSVFSGRDARLNRAIFEALALKGQLTAYQIYKHVKTSRIFRRKLYSVVNRRVRALQQQGYLQKVGERKTKAGFTAALYALTPKACLAALLSQIDWEKTLEEAEESAVLQLICLILDMSVF